MGEEVGKERGWDFQSMWGLHVLSQGIPKIIWWHPNPTTISSMFSSFLERSMWVDAFHMIVPHLLRESLALKARTGWDIFFRGRFMRERSPRSIKFPVAPESIRAGVLMICLPRSNLTGKQRVLSLSEATSTCDRDWEGNVEVTSHFKNPGQGWNQQQFLP